jgi:hypothetical protein
MRPVSGQSVCVKGLFLPRCCGRVAAVFLCVAAAEKYEAGRLCTVKLHARDVLTNDVNDGRLLSCTQCSHPPASPPSYPDGTTALLRASVT